MAYETIIVDVDDHVARITLNRPDALNALSGELLGELADAVTEAQKDDKVRCIVITGSEKAFAAGADIAMMAEMSFVDTFMGNLFTDSTDSICRARKPIIAAVSGYALGGGCELAMMCDFIIASESAKFGQPEVNLGVMAGIGGTQRLARFVGKSKAMDMNLTGRFMDAEEAERCGLVSRVVPTKKLMEEAMAAANKIASKSMISVMAIKESVNQAFEVPLRDGLLFERRLFHSMFATEDQSEGMAAFLEKREPQFRDK
ncbi:enoyl-CoA hydratase [Sulfitobacter pseudonitzschiae]|uniref:enoyl-CoA hydratase n=1 Tax=Pseudosulfitobacter pseudonitzschiae TaxID=1402135 RepID=A0A9Q2RQP4_9RHOB|nr:MULTISPECIES: enoyl-CoA hydratase [Roseobacteraceae]MBM2290568.1 enoyl-CoA hydratase [Pseudosulfitobacter pseudonitzschiae]MBM2295486.1 enoyl-CoA hydratase [Pseudosulfitobacter pseudonitzschiae]MBM2300398.1 enoyl-CoA hydratase [Pseudosulfitobacter pseudonitzschiae]MBM2310183.1 enoyl-CoA hydratase [Pseudosulfitobacter pseudonitzschiae]MBM2315095.1 enoyl-CoA hydratase [Pseudosulfitobacter pseudonitzschiae]|tara:strand:- start:349297 stop:350073 length:777 start_codon:yes stop_codon:yes gene_type:complete